MQIYSHGVYCYKEQGYDCQQVPAVQGFSRAVVDEKLLSPLFPVGEGAVVTNDCCIIPSVLSQEPWQMVYTQSMQSFH